MQLLESHPLLGGDHDGSPWQSLAWRTTSPTPHKLFLPRFCTFGNGYLSGAEQAHVIFFRRMKMSPRHVVLPTRHESYFCLGVIDAVTRQGEWWHGRATLLSGIVTLLRWLLPLLYHRRFLPTWQWPPSCRSVKMVKWRHLGTPPCAGPLPDAQTSWAAGATMTVLLLHLHDNLQLHLHLHTTLSPLCLWHASVSCLDHLHMVQFGLRPSSSARAASVFPGPPATIAQTPHWQAIFHASTPGLYV